ncbi:amidohydrolase [Butyricimonas hominis]|uniref:amidohydrolase n=1 Tax=Butyricimonas TaxID=574697 RepID=UPI003513FE2E
MKVAIVQARLEWENVPLNLKLFNKRMSDINGVDIIVLPEMFSSGFTMTGKDQVAPFHEAVYRCMQDWADEKDALVMGSTIYFEDGHYFNRLLAAFPGGKVLHYDKRHRFTMGHEDEHFTAGHELPVFEYKGMKIAPFICYDLRFPVWSRNTSGYDLAVYVSNWPEARREPWQILLKARAIENQCYVVGVNCVGEDGNGLQYSGDSMVISPRGEVLVACEPYADEVQVADVDLGALEGFREKFPVLEDRDEFTIDE